MIERFDHLAPALRVCFGAGRRAEAGDIAAVLGCQRMLVLSTPGQEPLAQEIAALLGERAAGIFAGARMHTPVDVTAKAMAVVQATGADGVVSIGGGSTTGLGKAISVRTGHPHIAIPTTYAGSEMTDILGETEGGEKLTRRAPEIRPEAVIYDVDLTLSLPPATSATSGINAVAHAVEALYARDGTPLVSLMAEEAVGALAAALPAIVADPGDRRARIRAQYGAWLCGMCLGSASMALHHRICHALGGQFDLPHAETHTIVLPHAAAYNAAAAPDAMRRLARALGNDRGGDDDDGGAPAALDRLNRRLGVPLALRDLGMPEAGIDTIADAVIDKPYWNPAPLERDRLRAMIADAWAGRAPGTTLP